jgi:hypothetical protein
MARILGIPAHSGPTCLVFLALSTALAVRPAAGADMRDIELQTLHAAILVAHLNDVHLPIVLAAAPGGDVESTAEAWTTRDGTGRPQRIVVSSSSDVFRCAMPDVDNHQCLLKLASILVHEEWHFRYGADEQHAYEAQLRFLRVRGASSYFISGVERARRYVMAREQR